MARFVSLYELLTDPVFRGPIWGALFMSISTSLMGAINLIRKKPLISEMLSHASFPGVVFGTLFGALLFPYSEGIAFLLIAISASIFCFLSQILFEFLIRKKLKPDVALCYLSAAFLGIGILAASYMQKSYVLWYRKISVFFYGQASTMSDTHIIVYAALACLVVLFLFVCYRPIKLICFDLIFAKSIGLPVQGILLIQNMLLTFAIVVGIRSVGIVLMTGMLIAPCISARFISSKFSSYLVFSLFFGVVSAFFGNVLAINWPFETQAGHFMPTGPTTVIVASFLAFLVMLFAPKKGVIGKFLRKKRFQKNCLTENLLKAFWKQEKEVTYQAVFSWQLAPLNLVRARVKKICREGFIEKKSAGFVLTEEGRKKAAYVVRLHRLWELYLAKHLQYCPNAIHKNAEEIEHLITPDIEKKLTRLLLDPKKDPHDKPIPGKEIVL